MAFSSGSPVPGSLEVGPLHTSHDREDQELQQAIEASKQQSETVAAWRAREEQLVASKLTELALVEFPIPRDGVCALVLRCFGTERRL